jgi:hypothetical protein
MRRSVSAGVIAAIVVIVVVVAAVGAYYYMTTRGGTVYFYLTDPGNPSSSSSNSSPTAIYLTITSIMIHSTSKGWITVSNKTMTVQLSSSLSFLSSATLPPGNYTEVRLVVSAVTVQMGPVNVSASLPSSVLKIPIIKGGLQVTSGRTAYLVIYMGPHLTTTGTGQVILRPVITAEAYYSPPTTSTNTTTTS